MQRPYLFCPHVHRRAGIAAIDVLPARLQVRFLAGGDQAVQQGAFLGRLKGVGPVVTQHFMPQRQHQVGGVVHVRQGHVHTATVGPAVVDRLLRDIAALGAFWNSLHLWAVQVGRGFAVCVNQFQRTGIITGESQRHVLCFGLGNGHRLTLFVLTGNGLFQGFTRPPTIHFTNVGNGNERRNVGERAFIVQKCRLFLLLI